MEPVLLKLFNHKNILFYFSWIFEVFFRNFAIIDYWVKWVSLVCIGDKYILANWQIHASCRRLFWESFETRFKAWKYDEFHVTEKRNVDKEQKKRDRNETFNGAYGSRLVSFLTLNFHRNGTLRDSLNRTQERE